MESPQITWTTTILVIIHWHKGEILHLSCYYPKDCFPHSPSTMLYHQYRWDIHSWPILGHSSTKSHSHLPEWVEHKLNLSSYPKNESIIEDGGEELGLDRWECLFWKRLEAFVVWAKYFDQDCSKSSECIIGALADYELVKHNTT